MKIRVFNGGKHFHPILSGQSAIISDIPVVRYFDINMTFILVINEKMIIYEK